MFDPLNIRLAAGTKLAVVGDIHEQIQHYRKLIDLIQPSDKMIFVSVGDIYDRGGGVAVAEEIIDHLRELYNKRQGYVVRGNHELKHANYALRDKEWSDQLYWIAGMPLVLSFIFANSSRITVLHGGVEPKHGWDDLNIDVSTSYIRDLDPEGKYIQLRKVKINGKKELIPDREGGKPWHMSYDGRFVYIASGHDAQRDGIPKFYNYSCNLDTACYETGVLTCQIFGENGREKIIQVKSLDI